MENIHELSERPTKKRFWLLGIILLTITVSYFDRVNVTVLMADDTFLKDMGCYGDPTRAGLLMTVFLIAYGFGNICLSGIGDYLGARKTMIVAMVGWFIAMMIGGIAPTLMVMLIARFLLGLGEGLHFPSINAFCRPWFPNKEKGTASATWAVGASLAPAVGLPVFTWLVAHYSWHYTFYICAILGLIPLYFVWRYTADTPEQHKTINQAELDYIKNGLAVVKADLSEEKTTLIETLKKNFKFVAKEPMYWVMVVFVCVQSIIWWTLMTWLPTYLKAERGFSWTEMGFLASMPFILAIISKIAVGWASDKVGRRAPFCVFTMGGAAVMMYLSATITNNWGSAICIFLGMGIVSPGTPMVMTMLQELLPKKVMSLGTGLLNGLGASVAALGPVAIGFTMSIYGSFTSALYLIIGLALVGMICAIILTKRKF